MKAAVRSALALLVLPTLAVIGVVTVQPALAPGALHAYVLVAAAILVATFALAARRELPREPSTFEAALRPRTPEHQRVAELDRVERTLELAASSAFDLHFRLRPLVRDVAAQLLASRRGLDLDGNPAAARAALGPEVWELVRPDRPAPDDRTARGATVEQLRAVVDALERV